MNEAEKLQLLGGALIVLSLVLLYCWYNKQPRYGRNPYYEGMSTLYGGYMAGAPRRTDGFSASMQKEHLPNLHLNESMHDMENYVVNRHPPSREQLKTNITGLRWASEAFTGAPHLDSANGLMDDAENKDTWDSTYETGSRAEELVGGGIITPTKPTVSGGIANCGAMQLLRTDAGEACSMKRAKTNAWNDVDSMCYSSTAPGGMVSM